MFLSVELSFTLGRHHYYTDHFTFYGFYDQFLRIWRLANFICVAMLSPVESISTILYNEIHIKCKHISVAVRGTAYYFTILFQPAMHNYFLHVSPYSSFSLLTLSSFNFTWTEQVDDVIF